jgi:hypothetical protein
MALSKSPLLEYTMPRLVEVYCLRGGVDFIFRIINTTIQTTKQAASRVVGSMVTIELSPPKISTTTKPPTNLPAVSSIGGVIIMDISLIVTPIRRGPTYSHAPLRRLVPWRSVSAPSPFHEVPQLCPCRSTACGSQFVCPSPSRHGVQPLCVH